MKGVTNLVVKVLVRERAVVPTARRSNDIGQRILASRKTGSWYIVKQRMSAGNRLRQLARAETVI